MIGGVGKGGEGSVDSYIKPGEKSSSAIACLLEPRLALLLLFDERPLTSGRPSKPKGEVNEVTKGLFMRLPDPEPEDEIMVSIVPFGMPRPSKLGLLNLRNNG